MDMAVAHRTEADAQQLKAWRDYVECATSDSMDEAASSAAAAGLHSASKRRASVADEPASWVESDPEHDLSAWLEEIGVGVPEIPVHDSVQCELEAKGYSADEVRSLQGQFERFAGFKFDRANSLEAALEARRKIFLEAEMELAKRNASDAKLRQEAAMAVVEERRRNALHVKQEIFRSAARGEQESVARLAARQQRQALELRARKVESLRENLHAIRSSRAEITAVAAESQQRTRHVAAYTARVSVARHALLQHTTPPTVTVPFAEWQHPDEHLEGGGSPNSGHLYLTLRRMEEPSAYAAFEQYTQPLAQPRISSRYSPEGTNANSETELDDVESDVEGVWLRDGTYRGWKRWRHEGGGYWLRRRQGMCDWRIVDRRTDEGAQGYPAHVRTLFVCRAAPGCVIDTAEPTSVGHTWHGTGVWAAPAHSGGNAPGVWSTTRLWPVMRLQFTALPPPAERVGSVYVPTAQLQQHRDTAANGRALQEQPHYAEEVVYHDSGSNGGDDAGAVYNEADDADYEYYNDDNDDGEEDFTTEDDNDSQRESSQRESSRDYVDDDGDTDDEAGSQPESELLGWDKEPTSPSRSERRREAEAMAAADPALAGAKQRLAAAIQQYEEAGYSYGAHIPGEEHQNYTQYQDDIEDEIEYEGDG